ncbi:hypothetical protein Pelsub_P1258 [Pelolinea submarina]|nr:hypothetical protein Pelsub_P1258 [Pelolinea submarina]
MGVAAVWDQVFILQLAQLVVPVHISGEMVSFFEQKSTGGTFFIWMIRIVREN